MLRRLQVPDPDPAVVAQGLQQPDDAAVLQPPPEGHVSVQVQNHKQTMNRRSVFWLKPHEKGPWHDVTLSAARTRLHAGRKIQC